MWALRGSSRFCQSLHQRRTKLKQLIVNGFHTNKNMSLLFKQTSKCILVDSHRIVRQAQISLSLGLV